MSPRTLQSASVTVLFLLGAGCQPVPGGGGTPQPETEPLLGLADFHNHEFGFMGFGGVAISHSVDPTTGCIGALSYDPNSMAVKDIVRSQLFSATTADAARGECDPSATNIAGQRVDTDNLKRAWQGGLRLMVMFAVNSEFLCEVGELAQTCPTDRSAVEAQIQAAKDLEARIDSASGGPGMGWYRIVRTPAEARQVIKAGKLAVVLGIEAGNVFGCRTEARSHVQGIAILPTDEPVTETTYERNCNDGIGLTAWYTYTNPDEDLSTYGSENTHTALALFEHYWDLGVRHFYLVHNEDGAPGGTAASIDLLHGELDPSGTGSDEINRVIKAIRPSVTTWNCQSRFLWDGGRCNSRGLEPMGRELAKLMAAHGALIDSDHLSWRAKRELLDNTGILGGVYPVISSHSGPVTLLRDSVRNEGQLSEEDLDQIIRLGGAIGPRFPPVLDTRDESTWPEGTTVASHGCGGTTESFIQAYRYIVQRLQAGRLMNGKPAFVGVGFGTDFGTPNPMYGLARFMTSGNVSGFTDLNDPIGKRWILNQLSDLFHPASPHHNGNCYAPGDPKPMVTYPIVSRLMPGAMPLGKSTTPWDGRATQPGYDISFDGFVHVGMIPDVAEEMGVLGLTNQELLPLYHGAEAYIRTWETAEAWKDGFDNEGSRGVRAACEAARKSLLDNEDQHLAEAVVKAIRDLRASRCRGIP